LLWLWGWTLPVCRPKNGCFDFRGDFIRISYYKVALALVGLYPCALLKTVALALDMEFICISYYKRLLWL